MTNRPPRPTSVGCFAFKLGHYRAVAAQKESSREEKKARQAIRAETGYVPRKHRAVFAHPKRAWSLDQSFGNDEFNLLVDTADRKVIDPSFEAEVNELSSILQSTLLKLDDVQRRIVKSLVMDAKPIAQVARDLGIEEPDILPLRDEGLQLMRELLPSGCG